MELSQEGLAAAAATRQAARKRQPDEKQDVIAGANIAAGAFPSVKRQQVSGSRPASTCTHEVALPEGFDVSTLKHDPEVHGEADSARRYLSIPFCVVTWPRPTSNAVGDFAVL